MPLPGLPTGSAPSPDEELWRLTKGRRVAVCWQRVHALGLELRLDVNGDTMRTTVEGTEEAARAQSVYMRQAMLDKGWSAGS